MIVSEFNDQGPFQITIDYQQEDHLPPEPSTHEDLQLMDVDAHHYCLPLDSLLSGELLILYWSSSAKYPRMSRWEATHHPLILYTGTSQVGVGGMSSAPSTTLHTIVKLIRP